MRRAKIQLRAVEVADDGIAYGLVSGTSKTCLMSYFVQSTMHTLMLMSYTSWNTFAPNGGSILGPEQWASLSWHYCLLSINCWWYRRILTADHSALGWAAFYADFCLPEKDPQAVDNIQLRCLQTLHAIESKQQSWSCTKSTGLVHMLQTLFALYTTISAKHETAF